MVTHHTSAANKPATVTLHRGRVLQFDEQRRAKLHHDSALVVQGGHVLEVLPWALANAKHGGAVCVDHGPCVLAPGFVDMHAHLPQLDVIASPAAGLLPWLTEHTFPAEARFSDPEHAKGVTRFFLQELLRNGVTTAMVFGSAHVTSVEAYFAAAQAMGLRTIAGKCLMDRNCPDAVRDDTEQSLADTQDLIERWHGVGRLGYAITPRFACTSTPEQLQGAGALAQSNPSVWVQSHVSENLDEIAWVKALFPKALSYLGVYADAGLVRARSVYAHCIHFDDADRALLRSAGGAAAVCPTSNQFLGSGQFDFARAGAMHHALASDVGGGMSFSPFATMRSAYTVARSSSLSRDRPKDPVTLSAEQLWWLHTHGGATALDLARCVGSLQPGTEADFVVIDPLATPLLARRSSQAQCTEDLLFAIIMLADDRHIRSTFVMGEVVKIDATHLERQ